MSVIFVSDVEGSSSILLVKMVIITNMIVNASTDGSLSKRTLVKVSEYSILQIFNVQSLS